MEIPLALRIIEVLLFILAGWLFYKRKDIGGGVYVPVFLVAIIIENIIYWMGDDPWTAENVLPVVAGSTFYVVGYSGLMLFLLSPILSDLMIKKEKQ